MTSIVAELSRPARHRSGLTQRRQQQSACIDRVTHNPCVTPTLGDIHRLASAEEQDRCSDHRGRLCRRFPFERGRRHQDSSFDDDPRDRRRRYPGRVGRPAGKTGLPLFGRSETGSPQMTAPRSRSLRTAAHLLRQRSKWRPSNSVVLSCSRGLSHEAIRWISTSHSTNQSLDSAQADRQPSRSAAARAVTAWPRPTSATRMARTIRSSIGSIPPSVAGLRCPGTDARGPP